jgi:hypothetical protein
LKLARTEIARRERNEYDALEEAVPDLIRLERYERRAWSRQRRAIREFLNLKFARKLLPAPAVERKLSGPPRGRHPRTALRQASKRVVSAALPQ